MSNKYGGVRDGEQERIEQSLIPDRVDNNKDVENGVEEIDMMHSTPSGHDCAEWKSCLLVAVMSSVTLTGLIMALAGERFMVVMVILVSLMFRS